MQTNSLNKKMSFTRRRRFVRAIALLSSWIYCTVSFAAFQHQHITGDSACKTRVAGNEQSKHSCSLCDFLATPINAPSPPAPLVTPPALIALIAPSLMGQPRPSAAPPRKTASRAPPFS